MDMAAPERTATRKARSPSPRQVCPTHSRARPWESRSWGICASGAPPSTTRVQEDPTACDPTRPGQSARHWQGPKPGGKDTAKWRQHPLVLEQHSR